MSVISSEQFKAISSVKTAADIVFVKGDMNAAKNYIAQYYNLQQNVRGYAPLAQQVVEGKSYNGRVANVNVASGVRIDFRSSAYENVVASSLMHKLATLDFKSIIENRYTDTSGNVIYVIPITSQIERNHLIAYQNLNIPIINWSGTAFANQDLNWMGTYATSAELAGGHAPEFQSLTSQQITSAYTELVSAGFRTGNPLLLSKQALIQQDTNRGLIGYYQDLQQAVDGTILMGRLTDSLLDSKTPLPSWVIPFAPDPNAPPSSPINYRIQDDGSFSYPLREAGITREDVYFTSSDGQTTLLLDQVTTSGVQQQEFVSADVHTAGEIAGQFGSSLGNALMPQSHSEKRLRRSRRLWLTARDLERGTPHVEAGTSPCSRPPWAALPKRPYKRRVGAGGASDPPCQARRASAHGERARGAERHLLRALDGVPVDGAAA